VGGVKVMPEEARLELEMRKLPALGLPRLGNSDARGIAPLRMEIRLPMVRDSRYVLRGQ
jgi:hypothetical protein